MPQTPSLQMTVPATPSAEQNRDAGSARRLAPGTALSSGRYVVEKLVAAGGMGAVYKATDTRFNGPCAVKEMLDDFRSENDRKQAVDWFSREAQLLLELNHPCIPRVRDFFAENGRHYLVMDFIDGRTLAEMMESEAIVTGLNGARGVTEARARSWARQVCSVLMYLHRQTPPIIFRDLKPSNVMVTRRDEVKLIDFGIARTFQTQNQSTIIMTIGYAPPEQLHGMPEPRSDIFALGATIHKLLTRHDAANNRPSIFSFPPLRSLRPDISVAFEQIIMRALAPALDQRWASAEEMERALNNLGNLDQSGEPPRRMDVPFTDPLPPEISSRHTTTGPAGQYIISAREHLLAGRIDAAYEAVKMAHGLEQNNAQVHKLFGQVYVRRVPAQVDTAVNAYNRSLQLNGNDAETHKLIGDIWLYFRPNYQIAIQAYTQSLRLNANDYETHERLAMCYERTNQLHPALHEYQEAVRLTIMQAEMVRIRLFFALAQIAMRIKQLPVAEHGFVQVLIMNPADHQARFLLSQVYEQEGKVDDAFRECGYVMNGPLGKSNPAVLQMHNRLKKSVRR